MKSDEKDPFKDPKILLNICDQEPIHIPGTIQEFGFSVVLGADANIRFASKNISAFTKITWEHCIGKDLRFILEDDRVLNGVLVDQPEPQYFFHRNIAIADEHFDVAIMPTTDVGYRVIEFEPSPYDPKLVDDMEMSYLELETAQSLEDLYARSVQLVKRQIGYDRVKLYLFDQDWHGRVVAEAKEPFMESFLGIHFPATDIPKQARALYETNRVRIITDAGYTPQPLLPKATSQEAVDLTFSGLRSISPIHIEYLKNMGVGASFSVSVLRYGKLHAMFACHNNSPKIITMRVRKQLEVLGRIMSLEMERQRLEASKRVLSQTQEKLDQWLPRLRQSESLILGLKSVLPELMKLLKADGLMVESEGRQFSTGDVPEATQLKRLKTAANLVGRRSILACERTEDFVSLARAGDEAGGFLYIPIPTVIPCYLIAFRNEFVSSIHWGGGAPENAKTVYTGEDGKIRVSPRKSFATFKEIVRNSSLPWTNEEVYHEVQRYLATVSMQLVEKDQEVLRQQRAIQESGFIQKLIDTSAEEQRLKLALELGQIGTWSLDSSAQNIRLDYKCGEILKTSEEVLTIDAFLALLPEKYHLEMRRLLKSNDTYSDHFAIELLLEGKSGRRKLLVKGGRWVDASDDQVYLIGVIVDVTEFHMMKTDIDSVKTELAQFFNSDIVGNFIAHENGDIIRCNDYFLDLLGYDRKFFNVSVLNWRIMTPVDLFSTDLEMINRTLMGERVNYTKQFFNAQNDRITVQFALSYDHQSNRFYGLVKTYEEFQVEQSRTKRIIADQRAMLLERHKKLQEFNRELMDKNRLLQLEMAGRLRAEEQAQLLQKAISHSSDMVMVLSSDFLLKGGHPKIEFANQSLMDHTGYDEAELLGGSPALLLSPNTDTSRLSQLVDDLKEKKSIKERTIIADSAGRDTYVDITMSPVLSDQGEVQYVIAVLRDVSGEVEQLQEITKAREQFKLISENLPDAVVALFNKRLQILYRGGNAAVELPMGEDLVLVFNLSEQAQAKLHAWLLNPKETLSLKSVLGGHEHDLAISAVGGVAEKQEFILLALDVENKMELLRLKERALEEAEQLTKIKSQFINAASHQLRTPVSSIELNLSLLNALMPEIENPKLTKIINRLSQESNRLIQLMDDTLRIARISSDAFEVDYSDFDLIERVNYHVELYLNTLQYKDRHIHVETDGSEALVHSDQQLLDQVLSNAVSNALKYSQKDVVIRITTADEKHCVQVMDEGMGIPAHELGEVFRQFYRAENTKAIAGTGLGLYLVKSIMDKLGGDVWVESVVGKGTKISICV